MKNKKGFTLIEIIICISLIVIIGTASFFGVKTIKKNITVDRLEKINDKILAAAEIYIETNKETYDQLHKKKNGVVIPLNVLVNEGLLSLENTDLKQTDIEDEYVITALTSSTPSSTSDCIDIRTSTSWMNTSSAPIYICTDSNGNYTNIQTISIEDLGNQSRLSRDTYYFRGVNANNWIKINDKYSRILSITPEDSMTLYTDYFWRRASGNVPTNDELYTTFGVTENMLNTIKGVAVNSYNYTSKCSYSYDIESGILTGAIYSSDYIGNDVKVSHINCSDMLNSSLPLNSDNDVWTTFIGYYEKTSNHRQGARVYWSSFSLGSESTFFSHSYVGGCFGNCGGINGAATSVRIKTQLKSCIKIKDGSGTYENPYTITTDECS